MPRTPSTTRRDFLCRSLAAGAALSWPYLMTRRSSGAAASEKITLGVIGIGPRCTYDLKAMLELPDVKCLAIADVQASRRDAGKALVDGRYGNQDCAAIATFASYWPGPTSTR